MSQDWVLITGASKGIGLAVAKKCTELGYRAIGMARSAPTESASFAEFLCVDLSDPRATATALAKISNLPITRLVNNMGYTHSAALEDVTFEDLNRLVNLNLRTTIQVTQASLPAMRAAHFGRIVNISSRAAMGKSHRTVYAAVKSGLHGLSRTWALELAPHITVNCVAPGPIETEMFRSVNAEESETTQRILQTVPMQRFGQPREIAHAVTQFLDKDAGFTTGQLMHVCGGLTVGLAG
ncbi:SDR family oxidoreductase [Ottowia thiooxydans]|uniref:SDR family oxidoreductase n=1 Tax=Ottowia thiooxydans TaxID=219182 RepID=UPI00041255BD|nr:SDR family oxidoreductase [Ottowia thiooxydans]